MSRPESDPGTPDLDSLLALRLDAASTGTGIDGPDRDAADAVGSVGGQPGAGPGFGVGGGSGREVLASDGVVGELRQIDVDAIVPNEYQPRRVFDEASLADLTDSIRSLGVLQPVLVRPAGPGLYELIAGERRWRAARRAGLPTVPAIVRSTGDQGSLEQAIVENLHRADLTAMEEAFAYQQLVEDFALTQDEIATRVGKSRSAVSNTLRLFQLPPAVQRMLGQRELSAGHARAILGLVEMDAMVDMAERVVGEELSVRATEEAVRAAVSGVSIRKRGGPGSSPSRPTSSNKSAGALEVEAGLEERLSTRVEVAEAGGTGRIVIRFADAEDLGRIYRLLAE